ncbi:hypothetical protein Vadar_010375 [Vaccinium darrowii]|uniref:Uncharacterized protein n=1 Tax=Vaccinium darrowii TaxID=229202 RepID=A0ACB7ZIB9_9ERIC|nr:hypothetical protein Vadar_010375 [Vaccinium darrowii]
MSAAATTPSLDSRNIEGIWWGNKSTLALAVGYNQKDNINKIIMKVRKKALDLARAHQVMEDHHGRGNVSELWLLLVAIPASVIMGYFIGSSFHKVSSSKILNYTYVEDDKHTIMLDSTPVPSPDVSCSSPWFDTHDTTRIYAASNPRGAESLPPGIVEPYSDFYLHRQQENSSEDLVGKPKYLLALAVGYDQKDIINEIVGKFSENFSIVLFHYDGKTSGWDQFEWSNRTIHISAKNQAKWWYAKRFLHPDIVSAYEYIFIWDEDLGVENFNAEEYLKLVKKHNLEISQPGIESKKGLTWLMTKRRDGVEVHK